MDATVFSYNGPTLFMIVAIKSTSDIKEPDNANLLAKVLIISKKISNVKITTTKIEKFATELNNLIVRRRCIPFPQRFPSLSDINTLDNNMHDERREGTGEPRDHHLVLLNLGLKKRIDVISKMTFIIQQKSRQTLGRSVNKRHQPSTSKQWNKLCLPQKVVVTIQFQRKEGKNIGEMSGSRRGHCV